MTSNKKILILGCSVALRVRPPASDHSKNKNYGQIIEDALNQRRNDEFWSVINRASTRAVTRDVIKEKDEIGRVNPEYVILNVGAVDAPNRDIPLWFSDVLHRKRCIMFYRLFNALNHYVIKKSLRRTLVVLRGRRSWTKKSQFKKDVVDLIRCVQRDSRSKLIVLGVNAGNQRIERQLPGTMEKYSEYNQILSSIVQNEGGDFVEVSDLTDDYFPDGVHYNLEGHQIIAKRLLNEISEFT